MKEDNIIDIRGSYFEPPEEFTPDMLEEADRAFEQSMSAGAEIDDKKWAFDPDDKNLFDAAEDFAPLEFEVAEKDQEDALASIVDEATLQEAVEQWFNREIKFATAIISGLIFRGSIVAVYGESQAGKTLLTSAVSACLSQGKPFGDLGVRKTPVVYLNSESSADYNKRYMGELEYAGIAEMPDFKVRHGAFDVRNPIEREKLIRILPKLFGDNHYPPMFVFDTLAQHLSGVPGEAIDENSAKDMGKYIYGLRDLAERTGGAVVIVAHSGKDAAKGIRGSSVIKAALDTEIKVETHVEEDGTRYAKVTTTKQKFCAPLEPAMYKVKDVYLKAISGAEEVQIDDGDVMVMPERDPEAFTRKVSPPNHTRVLDPEPYPIPDDSEVLAEVTKKTPGTNIKTKEPPANAIKAADIVRSYYNGQADRQSISVVWTQNEGESAKSLNAALSGAVSHGLLVAMGGGVYKNTLMPSSTGTMGSSADIRNTGTASEF